MATDADTVTEQSRSVYKKFCVFFTAGTIAVLVLLALMAIFLV